MTQLQPPSARVWEKTFPYRDLPGDNPVHVPRGGPTTLGPMPILKQLCCLAPFSIAQEQSCPLSDLLGDTFIDTPINKTSDISQLEFLNQPSYPAPVSIQPQLGVVLHLQGLYRRYTHPCRTEDLRLSCGPWQPWDSDPGLLNYCLGTILPA